MEVRVAWWEIILRRHQSPHSMPAWALVPRPHNHVQLWHGWLGHQVLLDAVPSCLVKVKSLNKRTGCQSLFPKLILKNDAGDNRMASGAVGKTCKGDWCNENGVSDQRDSWALLEILTLETPNEQCSEKMVETEGEASKMHSSPGRGSRSWYAQVKRVHKHIALKGSAVRKGNVLNAWRLRGKQTKPTEKACRNEQLSD